MRGLRQLILVSTKKKKHASQTATDSDVSSQTSVDSGLPSGGEEDSDSASDTEIVWAKTTRGVGGLTNVLPNPLHQGNRISPAMFLRQTACHRGCSPLPILLPSLPPKLPNLVPNPPSVQPNLQLESPFLWPVEHVQLSKVKYLRQQKWHTEPVAQ